MEIQIKYYALRCRATDEITSVYKSQFCILNDSSGRMYLNKGYRAERISQEEFETLLIFHGINIEKSPVDEKVNLNLFIS